jgi:hypothetical protein
MAEIKKDPRVLLYLLGTIVVYVAMTTGLLWALNRMS